jgi:hypothetical protein
MDTGEPLNAALKAKALECWATPIFRSNALLRIVSIEKWFLDYYEKKKFWTYKRPYRGSGAERVFTARDIATFYIVVQFMKEGLAAELAFKIATTQVPSMIDNCWLGPNDTYVLKQRTFAIEISARLLIDEVSRRVESYAEQMSAEDIDTEFERNLARHLLISSKSGTKRGGPPQAWRAEFGA